MAAKAAVCVATGHGNFQVMFMNLIIDNPLVEVHQTEE